MNPRNINMTQDTNMGLENSLKCDMGAVLDDPGNNKERVHK